MYSRPLNWHYLVVFLTLWTDCELGTYFELHETDIDGAPKGIALTYANLSLALTAPIRPWHMCLLCRMKLRAAGALALMLC